VALDVVRLMPQPGREEWPARPGIIPESGSALRYVEQ
jgi:hypothetical protein